MAVASSTTGATSCIPHHNCKENRILLNSKNETTLYFTNRAPNKRRFFMVCGSSSSSSSSSERDQGDVTSSSSSATIAISEEEEKPKEEDDDESSPMEVPKGPPSLISALNVEKALRGHAITDVDHYGMLGLRRGCSYDQVGPAYQNKVMELSSQGLEEEEFNKTLELLKESYAILSSEEERRLYDWSLARNEKRDRYVWPFEVDIPAKPQGTPPPQEPEDVGPTRVVGYFMLGWLVLAFTLSIVLNR